MNKHIFYFVLLSIVLITGCAGGEAEKKPIPEPQYETMMASAAADPFENGCVSCHKKTAQVDQSLPAYVTRISGHPEVKEATVNECYRCHEAEKDYSLYKKFYRGIHKAHWESKTFYSEQKGTCYSCHTVETNGVSGLKKYPLAGYRSGLKTGVEDSENASPKTKTEQSQVKQDQKEETEQEQKEETEQEQEQEQEQEPEPEQKQSEIQPEPKP
ncbi:cytochrome c3 family protein [Phosphitispora sp. TUW77]|uniref:cytochrome c3 family protein n=1 Tax=Phosphitispora sp. TUW77 TaxID=3152361 RepID=UPI003AB2FD1C